MSSFLTPLKDNQNHNHPLPKSTNTTRQGDWVCLHCHNLNFSFRKKCNRCKIQTRQENQRQNAYYLQYQQYYYQPQKENFPSLTNPQPLLSPQPSCQPIPFSPVNIQHRQETPQKISNRSELPSVSPLVKRWRVRGCESTQQSKRGGLFQNQSLWANIDLTYFQESPKKKAEEDEKGEESQQLERIVENIIL